MREKCAITQRANLQYSYTYACNRLSCFTTPAWAELLFYFERCWLLLDCFTLAGRILFQRSSVWCGASWTESDWESRRDGHRERCPCVCVCTWLALWSLCNGIRNVCCACWASVGVYSSGSWCLPRWGPAGVLRYRWSLCTPTPSDTADVCGFKYSTHETDYGNFSNQFIGTLGQFSLILHMMEQSGIYVSFCF